MTWAAPGPAMLFCPADRPERYAKAAERADVVILDLEDAVAPDDRPMAREHVAGSSLDPDRVVVRVNPSPSGDFAADTEALARTDYRTVMLAKTESAEQVAAVERDVIALVETPLGVVRAAEIAAAPNCVGLMWGAEDLVAAMGGTKSRFDSGEADARRVAGGYRDVPRHARASVSLAAAAFGKAAIDSVYLDIGDTDGLRAEALDAVALGYAATACIHPSQVAVIRSAYAPDDDSVVWATRVLEAAKGTRGVFSLDGQMVDAPVFRQAEAIVRRSQLRLRHE